MSAQQGRTLNEEPGLAVCCGRVVPVVRYSPGRSLSRTYTDPFGGRRGPEAFPAWQALGASTRPPSGRHKSFQQKTLHAEGRMFIPGEDRAMET